MNTLTTLKLSQIIPDENQPRKNFSKEALDSLKKSVSKYGVKNPVLVEEIGDGKYLLVDGERRYRVATALGLKELPVVIEPKNENALNRAIEQFHIQEQHEGWTPLEKASVVLRLSKELGVSMKDIPELLGINSRIAESYASFGKLINQADFQEKKLNIQWAQTINHVRDFAKRITRMELGKEFTRADESKFEKIIMRKIDDSEIQSSRDFTKIKDAFRKDPESIEEFMQGKISAEGIFAKTKARDTYHLRNARNNALQLENHLAGFMANADTKVEKGEIALMKNLYKKIKEFIDRFDE